MYCGPTTEFFFPFITCYVGSRWFQMVPLPLEDTGSVSVLSSFFFGVPCLDKIPSVDNL